MSSPWSMEFKRKMLQLQIAVRDPETLKIYPGKIGIIHDELIDRMNNDRYILGLPIHDVPSGSSFDRWEGRGYIRKDTGEFMQAGDAMEWATKIEPEQWWHGESIALRRMQRTIRQNTGS